MLADKAFKGYENTCKNWVLSITGAFNGTTRTYFDGMNYFVVHLSALDQSYFL
ncbi:hypothetical protein KY284_023331 [Solanum tuberosum]|nr:hypothetical protein KY284_023331 [Solanum tuberosum]